MRSALLLALFLTALFPLNSAFAEGRAFPPDNCTGTNPFMAFNGVASNGNTYCINGQSVLSNALPGCSPNQQVIFDGTSFICQDSSSDLNLPSCGAGQFLTSDGTNFSCTSTNVPTCQANYVLTYNGSAFVCVPKSASVPTCAANQFLTYNGTSFQCAATQQLTIPTCPSGQVLSGSGGNLTCVTPAVLAPTCPSGQVLTGSGGTLTCVVPTAGGANCAAATVSFRSIYSCGDNIINMNYECPATDHGRVVQCNGWYDGGLGHALCFNGTLMPTAIAIHGCPPAGGD